MYYIENYVQNNFLEMNIKDFLLLLLIYYKNKVFLLPQLLIKILSIVNNGKKLITEKKKLLFFLYLFSKNYYHLSNDNSEWIDNQNDRSFIQNVFDSFSYIAFSQISE